jgi:hypothetical protein
MTQVMAESCHPYNAPPVWKPRLFLVEQISSNVVGDVPSIGHNVEDPARHLHNTETVLEPFVRCARIDKIRHCQLVNVTESLVGW